MGRELLPPAALTPSAEKRQRFKGLLALIYAAACASFIVWAVSLTSNSSTRQSRHHVIPMNAQQILDECAALYTLPGPPSNFGERSVSDRYDPDAIPTLITNATIWTGNKGGKEVILKGEIFLEKGIVKYVGDRAPASLVSNPRIRRINARLAWVTPAIVDMHSHLGVDAAPELRGSSDTNSLKGLTMPWLRSLDGIDTHDQAYPLSISGGVATSLILPGSANAIGGQAFVIKLRDTKERSPLSRVLEPPYSLLNGTHVDPSIPPRWRHMKHAAGENPSRVYDGTRMDTLWAFRSAYNEARKIKLEQDEYCAKAQAHQWTGLPAQIPKDLKWEALVDVLRGRVKVNIHIYETVDFTGLVGLSNEFEFPIAAFHHAHEAYLVPDLIKQVWGGVTPGIAIFATNARYKRESYRGSEFAAKILHENGIRVAMKSDHPVLDSRFLLYEAAQAHFFGLDAPVALAAVTSTPAELIGMGHRIGYLRNGYDADVVVWDSHPLALGATPKQVFIDGISQLAEPHVLAKPDSLQLEPKVPNWDKEAKAALKFDGLPPLHVPDHKKKTGTMAFVNVNEILEKDTTAGATRSSFVQQQLSGGVVIVHKGKILCSGACTSSLQGISAENIVDLAGGSIVPGLTTYGGDIGLIEIEQEASTNDGRIADLAGGKVPSLLEDVTIQAVDGLSFGGRNTLLAYRSGVTGSIIAPVSRGVFGGLSTSFYTGAAHKLEKHAVVQRITALHVAVHDQGSAPSISTQVAALRKALKGGLEGETGEWYKAAAEGKIPLVVDVAKADHIATLLELKAEIESHTGKALRLVLTRATEAHLLAKEIAAADVGVILLPARQFPYNWDSRRVLAGPPLTPQSSIGVLTDANVTVGLGIIEGWQARNQRFDLAWAALESNGTLSRADAIALGSSNLESLLGLEAQHDLVAYHGGDIFDLSSRVAAVISPKRGFVDLI